LTKMPPGLTVVPLDGPIAAAAATAVAANASPPSKPPSNRDSWPVRPKGSTHSSGHRRTPTKDVIFVNDEQEEQASGMHLNASSVVSTPTSENAIFGTPIFEDITAAINAATNAVSSGQTSPRQVIVRSASNGSATKGSVHQALIEDRHSMEWPDEDLDDPLMIMRLEQELAAVHGDHPAVVEEFPGVPKVDPTDPRLGRS